MKDHLRQVHSRAAVSILSTEGRLNVPVVMAPHLTISLDNMKGQADLTLEKNKFFLNVVVEVPEKDPLNPRDMLGVDKGIINIATTSDGDHRSGKEIDKVRIGITKLKQALQKRGTKSAKRHLKKLGKKQSKFQKHTNHVISKKLVALAKGTGRGISLEDLTGILGRITVTKEERQRFGNWSFSQLDSFIVYKALLEGVPVYFVDPRNTSKECHVCGHTEKSNRKSRDLFVCKRCGYIGDADINAAINIAQRGVLAHRAAINLPIAVHAGSTIPGTAIPH
jgi:IS605 OrfB family transposase